MVAKVGFVGLGVMGAPMALNLVRAGTPLVVWNRSSLGRELLAQAGAEVARDAFEVFDRSETVLLMLAHEQAVDDTLRRGSPEFASAVRGRTVVHLGTTSPEFSESLGRDIVAAGGRYVESPVSGSRVPAERGELVAMVAGAPGDVLAVASVLHPMCAAVLPCGPVPRALTTKLAVNLFLITMVTGLTEAYHFAREQGLDLDTFRRALDLGPMSSSVSRAKLEKLVRGDFAVQAAMTDVHTNNRLIARAARRAVISTPLLDASHLLYEEAEAAGLGDLDMAAVVRAIEAGTGRLRTSPAGPRAAGSATGSATGSGSG